MTLKQLRSSTCFRWADEAQQEAGGGKIARTYGVWKLGTYSRSKSATDPDRDVRVIGNPDASRLHDLNPQDFDREVVVVKRRIWTEKREKLEREAELLA